MLIRLRSALDRLVSWIGLALAAGALDASAQDSDAVAAFVGQPVYESDGALLGFVSEVIVDRDDSTVAIVKRIDTSKATRVPGVLAVLTAEELKGVNLAWMPTLAGDVQMVLADGKVLFQNQEVAFVVATDRYAADDGINKVVVEYEPLPPLIDPFKAMDADAPVLREDLAGKTSGAHGPPSVSST